MWMAMKKLQMNRPVSFPLAIYTTSISILCIVCQRCPAGDLDGPTPSVVSPQGYGWVWTPTNVWTPSRLSQNHLQVFLNSGVGELHAFYILL